MEVGKRNTERARVLEQTSRDWKRPEKDVLEARTTSGCKNETAGVLAGREEQMTEEVGRTVTATVTPGSDVREKKVAGPGESLLRSMGR